MLSKPLLNLHELGFIHCGKGAVVASGKGVDAFQNVKFITILLIRLYQ